MRQALVTAMWFDPVASCRYAPRARSCARYLCEAALKTGACWRSPINEKLKNAARVICIFGLFVFHYKARSARRSRRMLRKAAMNFFWHTY